MAAPGAETDETDETDGRARVNGQGGADDAVRSSACPPVEGGASAGGLQRGAGRERRGKGKYGEDEEEWCAGHVCLRLRPDGLRERRVRNSGSAGGTGREPGGTNAGSGSEEASGSDDGSASASDGEVRMRRVVKDDFFMIRVQLYDSSWTKPDFRPPDKSSIGRRAILAQLLQVCQISLFTSGP